MKRVIDSNILFSALIKDSITRQIILTSKEQFLFPEYIFEELNEHKQEIQQKSGLSNKEFDELLNKFLEKVEIVKSQTLKQHRKEALEICESIDIDDVLFFACALAFQNSAIWSDDKKLKQQNKIKIISTEEMIKLWSDENSFSD